MSNTRNPPVIQPPDRIELREALAELRHVLAVTPQLDDSTIGSIFGFAPSVVQRQRLRIERRRLVIHDDI